MVPCAPPLYLPHPSYQVLVSIDDLEFKVGKYSLIIFRFGVLVTNMGFLVLGK